MADCFHCGGDHGLNHGKAPCELNRIASNNAKLEKKKNHNSSDGFGDWGNNLGGQNNQGLGTNEQNKLTAQSLTLEFSVLMHFLIFNILLTYFAWKLFLLN